ncbi:MAG TPA: hypothetical protein VGQ69_02455 [Gemmatimonadales bacterium]|nr:hypothetical protein [Gemmatimonadales bacterium]
MKRLVDSAASTAAGIAADSLLGDKGRVVAGALTGTATGESCPAGTVALPMNAAGAAARAGAQASAGAALVGAAKQALKSKATSTAAQVASAAPPGAAAGLICQPMSAGGVMPGAAANGIPGAAGMHAPGAATAPTGMPGGLGMMAAVTPVGMAVAAAPVAGQAVKGIKGMFGGKPMDKIAVLRELGKGRVELKGVKFIEGTAELEPGFEPVFAAVGEAIPLAEGTYILHVAAEQAGKDSPPDTALARKRLEKVWAALQVNGVSDQRVIATPTLPPELAAGRKPTKRGDARVELIRLTTQP